MALPKPPHFMKIPILYKDGVAIFLSRNPFFGCSGIEVAELSESDYFHISIMCTFSKECGS